MAGSLTDTYENTYADAAGTAATHLALYTVAPTDSTAGTEVTDANNYSRQAVTWTAASGGAIANDGDVTWPAATGSWGTIVAVAGVTSGTHGAGNIVFYSTLDANKTIGDTDVFEILDGDFDFSIS